MVENESANCSRYMLPILGVQVVCTQHPEGYRGADHKTARSGVTRKRDLGASECERAKLGGPYLLPGSFGDDVAQGVVKPWLNLHCRTRSHRVHYS